MSDDLEQKKMPEVKDLVIDAGLDRKELAGLGIVVGQEVSLEQKAIHLGSEDFVSGKALDDRIGCFVLVELAKRLKQSKNEIFFVFTIQEEMGVYGAYGAQTSAYNIEPDWAIAVDVTETNDFSENPTKVLGNGPCITVKDGQMIGNKCINGWLKGLANENRIPLQADVSDAGSTDALSISLSRGGVPSTVLGVAVRNLHSNIGIASRKDIEHAVGLLESLMKDPPKVCMV
ncbi:hypothetical protein HZB89_01635 [archaeon]|nr:hypothetical protein [archaeon]